MRPDCAVIIGGKVGFSLRNAKVCGLESIPWHLVTDLSLFSWLSHSTVRNPNLAVAPTLWGRVSWKGKVGVQDIRILQKCATCCLDFLVSGQTHENARGSYMRRQRTIMWTRRAGDVGPALGRRMHGSAPESTQTRHSGACRSAF